MEHDLDLIVYTPSLLLQHMLYCNKYCSIMWFLIYQWKFLVRPHPLQMGHKFNVKVGYVYKLLEVCALCQSDDWEPARTIPSSKLNLLKYLDYRTMPKVLLTVTNGIWMGQILKNYKIWNANFKIVKSLWLWLQPLILSSGYTIIIFKEIYIFLICHFSLQTGQN